MWRDASANCLGNAKPHIDQMHSVEPHIDQMHPMCQTSHSLSVSHCNCNLYFGVFPTAHSLCNCAISMCSSICSVFPTFFLFVIFLPSYILNHDRCMLANWFRLSSSSFMSPSQPLTKILKINWCWRSWKDNSLFSLIIIILTHITIFHYGLHDNELLFILF